jgi:hypothetical protein
MWWIDWSPLGGGALMTGQGHTLSRALADTPTSERSRQDRKRIEMLFAHLKRILKLGHLRLRGPCGAQDEFLLAATAQNLRKLAKLVLPTGPQMAHMT